MNQANSDIDEKGISEGMASLIGAVIGTAIEPDKTHRIASGRMNRPEDRGGEDIAWLGSDAGKFWLSLADQVGINTSVIRQIAQDPKAYGYDGIGHGNWDAYGNIIEMKVPILDDVSCDDEPDATELAELEVDMNAEQVLNTA